MALGDLSDPQAVIDALDEFDRIGRAPFLKKYEFGRAQRYLLRRGSRLYDSKAIAAAAHGYQFGRPLRNHELYGGLSSAVPKLRELGFEIVDAVPAFDSGAAFNPGELVEGRIYSWDELAQLFGFEPGWLNRMGGMGSLPTHDAVLIISHPGGGKSFEYDDYWDGTDLIYTVTASGAISNGPARIDTSATTCARCSSSNRPAPRSCDTAARRYASTSGPRLRRTAMAMIAALFASVFGSRLTRHSKERRLGTALGPHPLTRNGAPARSTRRGRRARDRATSAGDRRDPAETAALQEKAVQAHHELVSAVNDALLATGWTDVGEIPAAIDLWGRSPDGARTIFEMKTLRAASELGRVRSAIAQLLEYRYFFGEPEDDLCVVTDHPLSDKRVRLLRTLGIGVVVADGDRLIPGSPDARERLHGLLDDAAAPST